jgi:hypothetical protein
VAPEEIPEIAEKLQKKGRLAEAGNRSRRRSKSGDEALNRESNLALKIPLALAAQTGRASGE